MKGWIATVARDGITGAGYRAADGYCFGDSTPHHRHISVRDVFFIRNSERLLTIAQVESIAVIPTEKSVQQCPTCGTGQMVFRPARSPSHRCLHGHGFSQAVMSVRSGLEYRATFSPDYFDVGPAIETAELRPFETTNSPQLLLRPCDLRGLAQYIAQRDRNAGTRLKSWLRARPLALRETDADDTDFAQVLDEREHRHFGIRLRRGRKVFRDELMRVYDQRCMISGCTVAGLLEAAYIPPTAMLKLSNPTNGLLLRSDLHTLFDLNLIGIDPDRLTIVLHPDLSETEYRVFGGAALLFSTKNGPNRRALMARWECYLAGVPNSPQTTRAAQVPADNATGAVISGTTDPPFQQE